MEAKSDNPAIDTLLLSYAAAGIGIHDYDVRSGKIRWDARVHGLWGVPQSATVNYDIFMDGILPADREVTQAAVDASLDPDGSGVYRAEYRVVDQTTGKIRWIAATGQTYFEDREPVRLVGTVQDISAQRATEVQLRTLLDGMGEAYALLAPDFTVLELNDQAMALETRSRSEIVGKTHWEAFPGSEESELGQLYKKAMRERVPVALEHRYQWEDGSTAWLDMRAYPLHDGKLALFYRDVSARRQTFAALRAAEEFNARILASSADCIKVLDLDGKLAFMSEGALCAMEVDDFETVRDSHWPVLWKDDGRVAAEAALAEARAGRTGRFQGFSETMKGNPRW